MYKIKVGYKLELQTPEEKSYYQHKNIIRQNKKRQNMTNFEVVEVVLVQCNLVDL